MEEESLLIVHLQSIYLYFKIFTFCNVFVCDTPKIKFETYSLITSPITKKKTSRDLPNELTGKCQKVNI